MYLYLILEDNNHFATNASNTDPAKK